MLQKSKLITLGLYYKLHGVHRPVTMKKSVIKRRKRVVPVAQGGPASGFDVASNTESEGQSSRSEMNDQRGSMNPDGSVNLGFRPRQPEPRILPEPTTTIRTRDGQQQLPPPASDLTAYASHHQSHQQDNSSLTSDNRLPPMASYPSPSHGRPPSLSPNSFLSPSRKRSFTAADNEPLLPHNDSNSKRLSSIKSILNPSQQHSDTDSDSLDPSLRGPPRSPDPRYGNAPSPNTSSYAPSPGSVQGGGRDSTSEGERLKMERRAELKREAEKMREALKAKERELEEFE